MKKGFIKSNRIFTPIRKYGWIFTLLVAIGGIWLPKLGLFVIPIMVTLILVSFFKGRYWCGNFCPHGSLFDSVIHHFSRNRAIPAVFKSRITISLFFIIFMAKLVTRFIKVSTVFGTDRFWDKLGLIFVTSYLMVFIVGVILALIFSSRTWCNFCPMGVMQTLSYRAGKILGINKKTDESIMLSDMENCKKCGKCSMVCPMQLTPHLEFDSHNRYTDENCIKCKTCVYHCPTNTLTVSLNTENSQKRAG